MRSCSSHYRKNFVSLFKNALVVLLLIVLVGCSSNDAQLESDQPETDQPENEAEIEQLTAENEQLQTELDKAIADLKAAEARVKELEDELEAAMSSVPPEEDVDPMATVPPQIDPVPPERSLSDLLLGEWFFSRFVKMDELEGVVESLVFNGDGTGTQWVTYYKPSYLNADNFSTSNPVSESSCGFTWSLAGDTIHAVFEGGKIGDIKLSDTLVDYEFFPEQQQFLKISVDGTASNSETFYVREKPAIPEDFVEASIIYGNIEAQKAAYRRQFLGTWYFDITIWTFNNDGTGVWDIPEWGDQPAVKREFSYSASENVLEIEWADTEQTLFFWPKTNDDGSIMLNDNVKLTRYFDADNCPVSTEILSNVYDVMTGQMFYDFLGSD